MRCAALLFDLDGTLIESSHSIEMHWRSWVDRQELDWETIAAAMHGVPTRDLVARFAPHLDAAGEAEALEVAQAADTTGVVPMPGADRLLRSLPSNRWAVVTSGTRRVASARLDAADLPAPAVLVTSDDVRLGKPHPEPFLLGASRLGVSPSDAIVVEDSVAGVQAGKAGGFRVVAVGGAGGGADVAIPGIGDMGVSVGPEGLTITTDG